MKLIQIVVFLVILNLSKVLCQTCTGAETCGQCYAIPGCAWCSEVNEARVVADRCFNPKEGTAQCPAESIQDEDSSITLEELPLTDDNQISISKATVRLRAGDSASFQLNVKPAENFPLDLYMIVDLSFSLFDDLTTIKGISSDIADAIRNISTRFQIGFGTFVDKLTFPYIAEITLDSPFTFLGKPSACRNDPCSAPFSYVHNVNLTNMSMDFVGGFDSLDISTNADNPEGTLDAMAQAILCTDVVGWRENARKIMVVVTDATVHVAGDGIFAGILTPAPSECLTRYDPSTGTYTYVDNTKYDYPSLEQIRTISEANLVSPVFAVLENVRDYYESIADVLSGVGAQVVTIQDGSANIIDALETAYENIVSEVRLSLNVEEDDISIVYSVECPDETNANSDGLSCSNVTTDDTVRFTVNVTLLNCSADLVAQPRSVNVIIPGYGRFLIEVQGICACECEESEAVPRSPKCSGNGTFACGVCDCDEGWTGSSCSCRTDEVDSLICPADNTGAECSDRGECLCGKCDCDPIMFATDVRDSYTLYNVTSGTGLSILLNEVPEIEGEACECDNYRCATNSTGFVCSGDQGNCTCSGTCECGTVEYGNLPYTGTDCGCNVAFCYNQTTPYFDGLPVCNGRGDCNPCNREEPCNCFAGYVRPFCTPSAQALRDCFGSGSFERSCVQCLADNENYESACPECFSSALSSTYQRAGPETDNLPGSVEGSTRRCSYRTTDPICDYVYYIAVDIESTTSNQRQIIHVETPDCFPLRWWHIALILLVGLLILGIIILVIIKIIFMILDYREVKYLDKSVAETDLSKNFNPLYQSPEVKYDNVAFGKE